MENEKPNARRRDRLAVKIAAFFLCVVLAGAPVVSICAANFSAGWFVGICLSGFIVAFLFLLASAGHRRGFEGIRRGLLDRIPFDLLTAGSGILLYYLLLAGHTILKTVAPPEQITLFSAVVILAASLALGWCVSLAIRFKSGTLWRNNLICYVLVWIWKQLGRLVAYVRNHPAFVWKTVAVLAAWLFVSSLLYAILNHVPGLAYWMLNLLVTVVIVYAMGMLHRLLESGREIAKGDLEHRVETRHMVGGFREHAETLNRIREGMSRAVEERLKSERMKTELITNVSHDLKTPLTSIINYCDLITKEDCDNQKIAKYSMVLSRQSERLKKLVVDLIEASKASTGNMEVCLAPCDVGILLSQATGEFMERLDGNKLDLVVTKPEGPVWVMADGKLLWRVFDNLLDNVCKYAMPCTRVYLTLEEADGEFILSFKNVSKSPLNIKAEELMERFVRGDSSRHTEGSGLGLSIARSLMELQLGRLVITIDGDFFRADLHFQPVKEA